MGVKTLKKLAVAGAVLIALGTSVIQPAYAVAITYTAANESGSTWLYSYSLSNDSLAAGISEFRIFFTLGDFTDLEVAASPAGWDSLVADPDPGLPDDGFFDSLSLTSPLAVGESVSGFQVRFTWLGAGTPSAQSFSVLDPETFESLLDGRTTPAETVPPPTEVPEPGTLGVFVLTLAAFGWTRRRKQNRQTACVGKHSRR